MPRYQYEHTETGAIIERTCPVAERDNCPPGYRRVVVPQTVGYANSSHLRETGADVEVPRALRDIELSGVSARDMAKQMGFKIDTIKDTWGI